MEKKSLYWMACLFVLALAAGGRAPAGENILRNGGFEEWTGEACSGWSAIWPNFLKEAPRFERGAEGPHGGTACATLRLEEGAGYSSYTQRIEKPPAGATFAGAGPAISGWPSNLRQLMP